MYGELFGSGRDVTGLLEPAAAALDLVAVTVHDAAEVEGVTASGAPAIGALLLRNHLRAARRRQSQAASVPVKRSGRPNVSG